MTGPALRLRTRLLGIQALAAAMTALLVVAFAPRLLLLDATVVAGSISLASWGWWPTIGGVVIVTWLATRGLTPVVQELASGRPQLEPSEVLSLHAMPARLVGLGFGGTALVALSTLVPPLRPATNDLSMQGEVVLLVVTMASVTALPAYVAMRAVVAKAMELVPVATARDAIDQLAGGWSGVSGVRQRLLAAVVAPVAFVALSASLLVQAHLRAFDASSRLDEAAELVRGVFGSVSTDRPGRTQAAEEARARGFDLAFDPSMASFEVSRDGAENTVLTVPLADGHAVVRYRPLRISRGTEQCIALAFAAVGLAAILGSRIGRAFAADFALATHELEATGVADVLRGGRIRGDASFQSVAALMRATDELGGVFRQFASAQQRAISARAATERMRGLFLASMSHDLKAPLNAILGFAALVSRGELSDAQRESVGIIEQRGRELLYLIDTILDAGRVEAGELTVSPEWSRVDDVVTSAIRDARVHTVGLDVDVTGEIQPGLPQIIVDPARLAQALTALILVAVRFADHGHVIVRAALPAVEERMRIDVEVTGRVIAAADRKKVFDAFAQADRARRHGSLGLGPSLARAIVELHGGGIDVETTEAGGTVFHTWLPSERPSRVPAPR